MGSTAAPPFLPVTQLQNFEKKLKSRPHFCLKNRSPSAASTFHPTAAPWSCHRQAGAASGLRLAQTTLEPSQNDLWTAPDDPRTPQNHLEQSRDDSRQSNEMVVTTKIFNSWGLEVGSKINGQNRPPSRYLNSLAIS